MYKIPCAWEERQKNFLMMLTTVALCFSSGIGLISLYCNCYLAEIPPRFYSFFFFFLKNYLLQQFSVVAYEIFIASCGVFCYGSRTLIAAPRLYSRHGSCGNILSQEILSHIFVQVWFLSPFHFEMKLQSVEPVSVFLLDIKPFTILSLSSCCMN